MDEVAEENPKSMAPAQESVTFSRTVLNKGFRAGLILSGACFVGSILTLIYFMVSTSSAVSGFMAPSKNMDIYEFMAREVALKSRVHLANISLTACGLTIGMSLGFLGFALFLVGMRGESSLTASTSTSKLELVRISPGAIVMICSTILIGWCIGNAPQFRLSYELPIPRTSSSNADQIKELGNIFNTPLPESRGGQDEKNIGDIDPGQLIDPAKLSK